MEKKLKQLRHYKTHDIFSQMTKVFLVLILILTTTYTGIFGNNNIDIAEPASASSMQIQLDGVVTATINGDTITFTPDGFNGGGWGDDRPYIGLVQRHSYPTGIRDQYGDTSYNWNLSGMWIPGHIYNQNPLIHDMGWGQKSVYNLSLNSSWVKNLTVGSSVALFTYYNQSTGDKVFQVSNATVTSVVGGAPPPPTIVKEYPKTCPVGLTPRGTPGTVNFYCEKPVKVTEKEYVGANDIDLDNIMGEFGSTGERGDGQFNLDSGNHNNGWHLSGNGDSYKSNHVQFTNIPDNGHVNAIGNSWQPEYLITQGKLKIEVPKSPKATAVELQKRDTDLNTFKSTKSLSEVLAYKVTDLEKLKEIQNSNEGLSDLFAKTGSTYKYGSDITSHVVNSQGEGVYNNFKINESGYYIIASKYIDMVSATKEQATPSQETITKHTYYSFIPVSVNFMTDLGYLPIQNNLLTQINDSILTVGNKKANHKLPNLEYQTYKSLKAPSAYNHTSGKTVIGSTSGGVQLLSKDLNPIAVSTTVDVANIKITDVVEYNKGFYISSDKGILYLNCETDELIETSVKEAINDLEVEYDTLYYLTDDKLSTMFVTDGGLINSNRDYDLATMFKSSNTKAGRVEVVGNLITVSSKDDSVDSEIITLAK